MVNNIKNTGMYPASELYRQHKKIVVQIDKVLRDLIPDYLETRRKDVQKLQGR